MGLVGILYLWGRGPLKPMGRPDGRRAAVGLGGIYGADVGLLWGGCGPAIGLGVGLAGILWGWGGFYGFCGTGGIQWDWGDFYGAGWIL